MIKRCEWCEKDEIYRNYHDNEWGEIFDDDRKFFEFLILEIMQAGLSWHTVLKKREDMRVAFDEFDPNKIALYDDEKIDDLLKNSLIIKNRLKISSLPINAKAFLEICDEFGSFYNYIWKFTNFKQIKNRYDNIKQIPTKTNLSDIVSKDLKKRGFKFVGSIGIYSFLQACGVVNDHLSYCFKFKEN
ncbi:DNA-3-methyladenine glycosylase I [Campylobacter pinnipediorum]|uniref:DNA-3-methyladenine glycosylase I n=1 Tax=Campylobacter pinnipediorum TaxID=1965231 RepID=UPI00112F9D20